jgi:hypothetical protein
MKKIQFQFSDEDYELLKNESIKKGVPMADLVRQSLTRGAWLEKVMADPKKKLIVEHEDGSKNQIVPL